MASPFTGGIKLNDGFLVAAEKKKQQQQQTQQGQTATSDSAPAKAVDSSSGAPAQPAASSETNSSSFLIKRGLLEVVNRGGLKPIPSKLSVEERVKLALSVGVECIQPEELQRLFETKEHPICYDGFEPSGRMHIAQGILKAINVNKLTDAGCVFVFWVADWFGMLNNKMGGDLNKIRKVGQYFIHVWKAAGMRLDNVRFLWTSEEINRDPESYWQRVMDVAQRNSINRIKRCGQIMGRSEGDDQPSAQILYPCMQCSDIFYIGADICQLGLDQRKVNMLAREYVDDWNAAHKKDSKVKLRKPIILSHGMLPGLLEGQAKMSKSDPDSAIFMEDSPEDVRRKVKKAYCPPGVVEDNPVVAYIKELVFSRFGEFEVKRTEENGGTVKFTDFESFERAYGAGDLHPGDVKPALAAALNELLQPVRDHFVNDPEAKALLAEIRSYKTTR